MAKQGINWDLWGRCFFGRDVEGAVPYNQQQKFSVTIIAILPIKWLWFNKKIIYKLVGDGAFDVPYLHKLIFRQIKIQSALRCHSGVKA